MINIFLIGTLGASPRDNNSITSNNTSDVRFIKTESKNYGLDNTSENQSYKRMNATQPPFSDGEVEFTPVNGPRNVLTDDDDLDAKYQVHKSYVGMCIDMGHMMFRSPHVYMVTDCESDPTDAEKTKANNEEAKPAKIEVEPLAQTPNSQVAGTSQGSALSAEIDSLSSALKLHEATAKSCVPCGATIPEDAFEQEPPASLKQAFQHSANTQDVTVILAPRYDLPECESAQHSTSGTQLELNPNEIAQIEERIRKNSAKKSRPGSASSSSKKHHTTKDNIH